MTSAPTAKILLSHWVVIAIASLLAGAAGFGFSKAQTPAFTATSAQYFSISVGQSGAGLGQSATYVQDQMPSFNQLAKSPLVLNPVIDSLRLDTTYKALARKVVVTTARDSVIMQIAVVGPDPVLAARTANAIGSELSDAVAIVGPKTSDGKSLIGVKSIQTAVPAAFPYSPNSKQNVVIGLLAGLILGCALVLARARLDKTVRVPAALRDITDAPLLGSIRRAGGVGSRKLLLDDPDSKGAEDVRRIRASLEQMSIDKKSLTVALISASRSEGRSTIAANLSAALAEVGKRAVLLEADLRHPSLASLRAGSTVDHPDRDLLDALSDGRAINEVVKDARGSAFPLIAAGGTVPNPTLLLAGPNMKALLLRLRENFDFILVDTPALLESSEATVLAGQVDGAIMIVDGRHAQRAQVQTAIEGTKSAGLKLLGVMLNQVAESDLPTVGARRAARHSKQGSHLQPPRPTEHDQFQWELPSQNDPVSKDPVSKDPVSKDPVSKV